MANAQQVYMFLFLLSMIGCLEIQFSEGRQLKAMKGKELSQAKTEAELQRHAKATNVGQGLDSQKEDQLSKISAPVAPIQISQEFSSSKVSRSDVPKSTTQGNSPGVGHSFSVEKHNMQASTFATGETDGFHHTTGHSPGVGHSFGNLKDGLKA